MNECVDRGFSSMKNSISLLGNSLETLHMFVFMALSVLHYMVSTTSAKLLMDPKTPNILSLSGA